MAPNNKSGDGNMSSERLEKMLQLIQRQFVSQRSRPPDSAAVATGRQLAMFLLEEIDSNRRKRIPKNASKTMEAVLKILARPHLHPAVPVSFFRVVETSTPHNDDSSSSTMSWLGDWCIVLEKSLIEQQQGYDAVHACLRAYSKNITSIKVRNGNDAKIVSDSILNVYSRLQLPSSRRVISSGILQQCETQRFSDFQHFVSPIMAVIFWQSDIDMAEKSEFLTNFWRAANVLDRDEHTDQAESVLDWLLNAWKYYVWSIPQYFTGLEMRVSALEMANYWLQDCLKWARGFFGSDSEVLNRCLQLILRDHLSLLTRISSETYTCNIEPILQTIYDMAVVRKVVGSTMQPLDTYTTWQIGTLLLTSVQSSDSRLYLELLEQCDPTQRTSYSLLHHLSSMYRNDSECHQAAVALGQHVSSLELPPKKKSRNNSDYTYTLIDNIEDKQGLVAQLLIKHDVSFDKTDWSATKQTGALLFGMAMLSKPNQRKKGYKFLQNLLAQYKHLGIILMPALLHGIRQASQKGRVNHLNDQLEFMCEALVVDPHCAQHVWSVVGNDLLLSPHIPTTVRVTCIRLFPLLCAANSRLYRRVIECMHNILIKEKSPEMRLAVVASLSDLAKADLVRDVSDVIPWIQNLLEEDRKEPMNCLLVHFALMTLHYLVRSNELDFDVVVKVLNKRLCLVTDISVVKDLPPVILEALILLLGDGCCNASSSEEEEAAAEDKGNNANAPRDAVVSVSAQVTKAIDSLLGLGHCLAHRRSSDLHSLSESENERAKNNAALTDITQSMRQNIISSLSQYSDAALNLDEEGVRKVIENMDTGDEDKVAIPASGDRYISLKTLIFDAYDDSVFSDSSYTNDPLTVLSRRVIRLEEESLGVALWQRQGKQKEAPVRGASKAIQRLMPTKEKLRKRVNENPGIGSSIALLISTDGTQLSIIRDNCDQILESTNPFLLVFALQGCLNAAARILSQPDVSIQAILAEVVGWYDIFVSPDGMYFVMSCFSLYTPVDVSKNDSSASAHFDDIYDVVFKAYQENGFQKDDVGKICLGLIGAGAVRREKLQSIHDILSILEHSVRGYGGKHSFGAFYAMGLICQTLSQQTHADDSLTVSRESKNLISRIAKFVLEELLLCFEDRSNVMDTLLSAINSGAASDDVLMSIAEMEPNSISVLMTKQVQALSLFVSGSLVFPALASVHGSLLLSVFHLLDAFEWGCGKGISLPAILSACQRKGFLLTSELGLIYSEYYDTFQKRIDNDEADIVADGLEDIYFAVNNTSTKPSSHVVRQIIVGNEVLFDDDGRALSLVASISKICTLPCLGGDTKFYSNIKMKDTAALSDVKSVISIVEDTFDLKSGPMYSNMGFVLYGLLASLRLPPDVSAIDIQQAYKSVPEKNKTKLSLDLTRLPYPEDGTLLASYTGYVFKISGSLDDSKGLVTRKISYALCAMEKLSLPQQYAKHFLQVLLPLLAKEGKAAWISLLVSQVRERRRATQEGREFIEFLAKICLFPYKEWNSLLESDEAKITVLENIQYVASRVTPAQLDGAIRNLWQHCILTYEEGSSSYILAYLSGYKGLLEASLLSPKSMNQLRRFVLQSMYTSINNFKLEQLMEKSLDVSPSVLEAYTDCLKELPITFVEEAQFFTTVDGSTKSDSDALKICILLSLVSSSYYDDRREIREIGNAFSWMSRQLQHSYSPSVSLGFKRVALLYATVVASATKLPKENQIRSVFETLLATPSESFKLGLDWLSITVALYCNWGGSDSQPSLGYLLPTSTQSLSTVSDKAINEVFDIASSDMPMNLASVSRQAKLTTEVFNYLHRLHSHWKAGKNKSRETALIQKAMILCRSNSNEDILAISLVCDMLTR